MFFVLLLFSTRSCKFVIISKQKDFCKLGGESGATLCDDPDDRGLVNYSPAGKELTGLQRRQTHDAPPLPHTNLANRDGILSQSLQTQPQHPLHGYCQSRRAGSLDEMAMDLTPFRHFSIPVGGSSRPQAFLMKARQLLEHRGS